VTLCHTGTTNLAEVARTGDIVIAATGSAGLITADMGEPGAVLLDVGLSQNTDGRLVGDLDDAAREVAAWIAPMPGGTGPMTRAMLLTQRGGGSRGRRCSRLMGGRTTKLGVAVACEGRGAPGRDGTDGRVGVLALIVPDLPR
jgi:hypothetical protein